MNHPKLNKKLVRSRLKSPHWQLDSNWLSKCRFLPVPKYPPGIDQETAIWQDIGSVFRRGIPQPVSLDVHIDFNHGSDAIAPLLSRLTSLTTLSITGNFNEAKTLNFWMDPFAGVWSQLQYVNLSLPVQYCSGIDQYLQKMTQLECLFLDLAGQKDGKWKYRFHLDELPNLRQLSIISCENNPSHFDIPVLPSVTRLDLSWRSPRQSRNGPTLMSTWLPNISGMTSLETLALSDLTEVDAVVLAQHLPTQLISLKFRTVNMSDESALQFYLAVKSHTQLTYLQAPGVEYRWHTRLRKRWLDWYSSSAVTSLDASAAQDVEVFWPESCPPMKHLLALNWEFGGGLSSMLRQHTQLTQLYVRNSPEPLTALQGLRQLTQLDLYDPVPAEFFQFCWSDLAKLQITINGDALVPAFSAFLDHHPSLTNMELTLALKSKPSYVAFWNRLVKCPQLVRLRVRDNTKLTATPFHLRLEIDSGSTLRRLTRYCNDPICTLYLSDSHPLEVFSSDTARVVKFKNNIRKHQTLVELLGIGWGFEYAQKWRVRSFFESLSEMLP